MEVGCCCSMWAVQSVVCCLLVISVEKACGFSKVRGVNLGGWLVVEGWIKPSLFDGIPNGDMLDGTQVQFKSTVLQKYVSAENGGGANVTVDRDITSSWETFRKHQMQLEHFILRDYKQKFTLNLWEVAMYRPQQTIKGSQGGMLIQQHLQ